MGYVTAGVTPKPGKKTSKMVFSLTEIALFLKPAKRLFDKVLRRVQDKERNGEKAQFTDVNEHFEPLFNTL